MVLTARGVGFGDRDLRFRAKISELSAWGLGFRVKGLGLGVISDSRFRLD